MTRGTRVRLLWTLTAVLVALTVGTAVATYTEPPIVHCTTDH